eukprot:scaffold494895_cov22-Prasinocladus_malaysianus.AAC.1
MAFANHVARNFAFRYMVRTAYLVMCDYIVVCNRQQQQGRLSPCRLIVRLLDVTRTRTLYTGEI